MLTTQQTTDLSTWLKDQEQALPESLKMILVEDCLEELKNSEEARKMFNKNKFSIQAQINEFETNALTFKYWNLAIQHRFVHLQPLFQVIVVQIFLFSSVPFLSKEMKYDFEEKAYNQDGYCYELGKIAKKPKTLDHLLFREFTEALRIGKSFESALEIITKIYLKEKYV